MFGIDADIAVSKTMPSDYYLSSQFFEKTKSEIFGKSWQFCAVKNQLQGEVTVLPVQLLPKFFDPPLILVRDKEQRVRCMSNVCTHRAGIIATQHCNPDYLRCPYHGRRFNLDGTLRYAPEFDKTQNFPSVEDNLPILGVETFAGMYFAQVMSGHSWSDYFSEMEQRIGWLPLNEFEYSPELSKNYSVNAHWSLYCENYLEGFHIPYVHGGLSDVLDYGDYSTELFSLSVLQVGKGKKGEVCFEVPPNSPDYGENIAAYYFWVFPNMMFNFYPWGLSVNIVKPVSLRQTEISFMSFVWKKELLNIGAGADLHTVEMEDELIVEQVQLGVASPLYDRGRYSPKREQGVHKFHCLLQQFLSNNS